MSEITELAIDYGPKGKAIVVADGDTLARRAASIAVEAAERAIAERGSAAIALSGGSTPRLMGEILAQPPYRDLPLWERLWVFWGDERWVPLDHDESNAGVARRTFLDHVTVVPEQVHPMPTVDLTPDEAARAYEALIRDVVPLGDDGIPRFDLIFLGMGEDGHTASLFPGTPAIHEADRLVVANYVPKLETTRLTMTPPLLNAGRKVVFLVSGTGKAERLAEVLEGPYQPDVLPSQIVRPSDGSLIWLTDRSAAAALSLPQAFLYG